MTLTPQLTLDERAAAYELWEAMVSSTSPDACNHVGIQLAEAPFAVQQAILRELVGRLRQGDNLTALPNPFISEPI